MYPATHKNQYDYMTSSPVYLYGNKPASATTLMTQQYVAIVVPITVSGVYLHTYIRAYIRTYIHRHIHVAREGRGRTASIQKKRH